MKAGNIIQYISQDYPGETDIGFVLYLDTDDRNEVVYVVRWSKGDTTKEYTEDIESGIIKVIQ